jgi:N-methylhydantoinase A/oxoprolinase/acetone carboxylase beta subunit
VAVGASVAEAKTLVGVDVGGTFTDFACVLGDGRRLAFKVPSTPADPSQAVIIGLRTLVGEQGVPADGISVFSHGTTVATNAVLERKGAVVGLLTTEGFRDVLEIGRQMRRRMYSVRLEPETPVFLAPGRRRVGVVERIAPDGAVLRPLDEASVVQAVEQVMAEGATSLAVALLFSFVNPAHERRVREIIAERWPAMPVSLSSDIDPVFREYERTVVTAFDAYIKPTVDAYLGNLAGALGGEGLAAPLRVMQSRGGLAGAAVARRRPVRLFLSGPAAGVIGALGEGEANDHQDLITVDIGGTSCDIALINDAKPLVRQEGVIDGFTVRVPMVDVNAIGAGGGSIAWIDGAGGLKVGPHSAGSAPGPACYGRGGGAATVTDASVVLGLIDPGFFAGGRLALDPARARRAIEDNIAKPLSLSVEVAALGIHRVLTAQMAEGIRLVSIKQGFDPRGFALLGLGGAGPLHACALAEELSMTRVLVPRHPGVLSAAGLLTAPVEHEVSSSFSRPLDGLDLDAVKAALAKLDVDAAALMADERLGAAEITISYSADVCYVGQGYHLEVPLDLETPDPLSGLYRDFLVLHDRIHGHSVEGATRIVNLRAVHRAPISAIEPDCRIEDGDPFKAARGVLCGEGAAPLEARVYDRTRMKPGFSFDGPAVVEQDDTTTWVPPGWRGTVRDTLLLLLERLGDDT